MTYNLRPWRVKRDFLPLIFYMLPQDILPVLRVAELAATSGRPGYKLRSHKMIDGS
eukprot:COSAG02_NODE_2617_length_8409_cov_2.491697_8_plen_56_part_00